MGTLKHDPYNLRILNNGFKFTQPVQFLYTGYGLHQRRCEEKPNEIYKQRSGSSSVTLITVMQHNREVKMQMATGNGYLSTLYT